MQCKVSSKFSVTDELVYRIKLYKRSEMLINPIPSKHKMKNMNKNTSKFRYLTYIQLTNSKILSQWRADSGMEVFMAMIVAVFFVVMYSKTCVRQPPLKLTLVVDVERWLSYKGTCHVILLAKLHDMYLYRTDNFFHINHYLKSVSKVALLHRFYCTLKFQWLIYRGCFELFFWVPR